MQRLTKPTLSPCSVYLQVTRMGSLVLGSMSWTLEYGIGPCRPAIQCSAIDNATFAMELQHLQSSRLNSAVLKISMENSLEPPLRAHVPEPLKPCHGMQTF